MPKQKKSLKSLHTTHGKLEETADNISTSRKKGQYQSLDQLFGDNMYSHYDTLKEDEYTNQLNDLNLSDLQTHATKVGIMPTDNRERLTKNLLREFNTHVAKYKVPNAPKQEQNNRKQPSAVALKIMSEGR